MDIIGVMSGTSLDGVDLAYVRFKDDKYRFEMVKAITLSFPNELLMLLKNCRILSNQMLIELHHEWSIFVGKEINKHFITKGLTPNLIASHGHTVFHEPRKGISLQIGSLPILNEITQCNVVGDFRMLDVCKGGEGAPLVPIGDQYLFPKNKVCLNLGGIANVSIKNGPSISAFDICPCNLLLNKLANKKGLLYDNGGHIAKSGLFDKPLFNQLNEIPYYLYSPRPSLGIEVIEKEFYPILERSTLPIQDITHTVCQHIAYQLKQCVPQGETILVTGGGAYNHFLIDCFERQNLKIEIPSESVVEFKEALIFAFLGLRKIEEKVNVLKEVTGASSDSIAGHLFL